MEKIKYFFALMVLCSTASVANAQGFEDELYNGRKKKESRTNEYIFTNSSKSSAGSVNRVTTKTNNNDENLGVIGREMSRDWDESEKSNSSGIDSEDYYPGMFEDAVNGSVDNAYEAKRNERDNGNEEGDDVTYIFVTSWAPSWYAPWGGYGYYTWGGYSTWSFFRPYDPFFYIGFDGRWTSLNWGWGLYPFYDRYVVHYYPSYRHRHRYHAYHRPNRYGKYGDRSVVHSAHGVIRDNARYGTKNSGFGDRSYATSSSSIFSNKLQAPRGNSHDRVTTTRGNSFNSNNSSSRSNQYNRSDAVNNSSTRSNSNSSSYNRSNSSSSSSSSNRGTNRSGSSNSGSSNRGTTSSGGRR